ncbi:MULTISPECIES: DNA (cytosine-5-)-methyltransferase [Blautia]|uniref:DNA (cytosine-5-)-methyltransferase n=1 Tax=Blautia TaxID=572511 RepID=UPI000BA2D522|nr:MULTISPECIES: DNA (cytosine-5-)-methyltransferase [Blautia]
MKKTVCELFAGVGGFRCGLNHIKTLEDVNKKEKWNTVWFNQWEPAEKKTQYAHDCYVYRFGNRYDINGNDTTNVDIEEVDKSSIPDFNLLVGGFPCQDYSVASSLATSKGLEGKKGILWWSIRDTIEAKQPPFILLENVDRLLKSPAKQRGRDFGIILACLRDQGYTVEWRVINAADYGYQQRRRRTFIFAYRDDMKYCTTIQEKVGYKYSDSLEAQRISMGKLLLKDGFFAETFPVNDVDNKKILITKLPDGIGELSEHFSFGFENTGIMKDGVVYSVKTTPKFDGTQITLGDIMETGDVDESYFISEEKLYYTDPLVTRSDETKGKLPKEDRQTWQYLKGGKKLSRKSSNGHEYIFSEGAIAMLDSYDKPARTMLTSEGGFSRTTHIVKDKQTGRIRLLTATETERIQGFPTDHTKFCLVNEEVVEMPVKKRRFMMGNALVVNLIEDMERTLDAIFDQE